MTFAIFISFYVVFYELVTIHELLNILYFNE